ncbi:MAG: amino acid-binding protein, partial [Desulfobacterales bacterium]
HRLLDMLHNAEINVEYMYAFVQHSGENAVMIFRIDNIDEAVRVLEEHNVKVINGSKVYTL